MSDYTKGQVFTNLRDQDADPAVFDTEFAAVATSSATKVDKSGATMTGYLSVPSGGSGNQVMQASEIASADALNLPLSGGTMSGQITLAGGGAGAQAVAVNEVSSWAFPAGTRMAFFQASAPAGWTQYTGVNDSVIRIVSGTGGGTGGSGSISTGVVMPTATNAHTLATSEIPSHTHRTAVVAATSTGFGISGTATGVSGAAYTTSNSLLTEASGSGGSHTHSISGTNWAPKYANMIIATKN